MGSWCYPEKHHEKKGNSFVCGNYMVHIKRQTLFSPYKKVEVKGDYRDYQVDLELYLEESGLKSLRTTILDTPGPRKIYLTLRLRKEKQTIYGAETWSCRR